MKLLVCFLISISLLPAKANANDSTLLKERIQKLKEFAHWLGKNAKTEIVKEGVYYQYDSASNKNWKTFDEAISLFYNKGILDSLIYNNEGTANIFTPSMKAGMVKGLISRFAYISKHIQSDDLNFRHPKFDDDYIPTAADELEMKNVLEQYFGLNGEDISYLIFFFENGTSKIVGMTVSEPQGLQREKLISYLQNLKLDP